MGAVALGAGGRQVWRQHGLSLYMLGREREAEAELTKALAVWAKDWEALYGRGLARAGLGQYGPAADDLAQIDTILPVGVAAGSRNTAQAMQTIDR